MSTVNKVFLLGNLGGDIELRFTGSGQAVGNMSVATSYKPKAGEEQTEWTKVTVWGKTAENCAKFLSKGSKVHVEGRLKTSKYEKDGETRYSTEVVAENVTFIGSKSDQGKEENSKPAASTPRKSRGGRGQSKQEQLPNDDLPF